MYVFRLSMIFAISKGVLIATTVTLLDVEFWKGLIIAVISALIGFLGALMAAYIAVREGKNVGQKVDSVAAEGRARGKQDEQRSAKLDDIAAKLDAARRRTDLQDAKESDEHSPQS